MRHVLRSEYGTLKLSPMKGNSEGMIERNIIYVQDVCFQFLYVGAPLAVLGLVQSLMGRATQDSEGKRKGEDGGGEKGKGGDGGGESGAIDDGSWIGPALASTFFFYLFVFHSLANLPLDDPMPRAVHSRFWMQPNLVVALWMGVGLLRLRTLFLAEVTEGPPRSDGGQLMLASMKSQALSLFLTLLMSAQFATRAPHFIALKQGGGGAAFSQFGKAVLQPLPHGSLLLSHGDLNWNSVRYLQACEGMRPDVTHLNFQLLPYPWFKRQRPLFPGVSFPAIRPGVSTQRKSRGNTDLIVDLLEANLDRFPTGHVHLEMLAINDADIAQAGRYPALGPDGKPDGRFILWPTGLTWMVTRASAETPFAEWNRASSAALTEVGTVLKKPLALMQSEAASVPIVAGSWEYAVMCVYWDANYQRGLHLLSHALELAQNLSVTIFPQYMSELESSVEVVSLFIPLLRL
jgi:hypothetical protein